MKGILSSMLFVVVMLPVAEARGQSYLNCVERYVPLYYATNPVYVSTQHGEEIDRALGVWEVEVKRASDSYWALYVGDSSAVPFKVEYGSIRMSCQRIENYGRIVGFTIYWNMANPWCYDTGDYPTGCVVGSWGFYDGMMHEVGHAVGLNHCPNICDDAAFLALPANVQIEALPTMVGGIDTDPANCGCNGLGCGYVTPANLSRSLSGSEQYAMNLLYQSVVSVEAPIVYAEMNGEILTLGVAAELCGREFSVMTSDTFSSPGPVVFSAIAQDTPEGHCELVVPVSALGAIGYVWLYDESAHVAYGPVVVEDMGAGPISHSRLRISAVPNPFNPVVEIRVSAGMSTPVKVCIHDLRGRLVCTLHSGELPLNGMIFRWRGTGDDGRQVSSGDYVVSVTGEELWATQKISLVR